MWRGSAASVIHVHFIQRSAKRADMGEHFP
nr:MAG TPA: hypothetical protein [Bacteriophage sp.]